MLAPFIASFVTGVSSAARRPSRMASSFRPRPVDQTEHTQRPSLIGLFAHGALEFGTRRGKRFLRCCIVAESTRYTSS